MQSLKTKLSRPTTLNLVVVQRPRLLSRLFDYSQQSLLFIHAAAGYGKTTLMYQLSERCISQDREIHWLTLDADDNDPIRLYHYLWQAWFGGEKQSSIPETIITKNNIIELMEKLAQSPRQHVLFLDEFESLDNNDCFNLIWWMYQYLPNNAHLVIASRIKPNWSFSKEILHGRLHVVNEDLLSVKSDEAAELIDFLTTQNFEHVALSKELVELLIQKTEGWITGIQLINLYLKRDHDITRMIQNLTGANHQIVDYLSEQVFLQLPEDIQWFLLQMSVLRKINLPLLQAVTHYPQADQILEYIKQRGLFILALDEQRVWYRIHHLFRDFLENRFKAMDLEQFKQTHSKAAAWYKAQHFLMEAIYHAQQAGDQSLVIELLTDELLTEVSRELILEGRIYTLLELVKQLPEKILVQHLHLLYDIIWSLLLTHQNHLANYYLKLWHSVEQNHQLLSQGDQLGLAPMIALLEDKLDHAYALAQQNLEKLPETAYFARGPLIGIGALHHIALGNVAEVRKLLIQTRATYIQGGNLYGLVFTDCVDATFERLLGHLTLAEEKFNQIGKGSDYQKLGMDEEYHDAVDAITSSLRADLYYEMNNIEAAERVLQKFNGGDQLVIPDMIIVGYVLQLRLAHLQGDRLCEQACLTQAQIRTNHWNLPRLTNTVQQIYQSFNPTEHRHVAMNPHTILEHSTPLTITNLLIGDDLQVYRMMILNQQLEEALEGLQAEALRMTVYPLRLIRIQLLQAFAYDQLGQKEVAFRYLEPAVVGLVSTRAVRIILDEHSSIWTMLKELNQKIVADETNYSSALGEAIPYLLSLLPQLNRIDVTEGTVKIIKSEQSELLSKREIQILEKVSEGYSDAEIAGLVFLSVNTVKWHLRNIYNKLNSRSRLEAVKDAKKIGLIT